MEPHPAEMERLRSAWSALVGPFGADAASAEATFSEIASSYSHATRFYHNLTHVAEVLDIVELLRNHIRDPAAIRLAAWLHDVIYDPRARDNEERSASNAAEMLPRLGVPSVVVARTATLILATKTHLAADDDLDCHILLDADLAVLGTSEPRYAAYSRAIRQEYAWVPDEAYRTGRREVLQQFLQRERIYRTQELFTAREVLARQNLRREIASLS